MDSPKRTYTDTYRDAQTDRQRDAHGQT